MVRFVDVADPATNLFVITMQGVPAAEFDHSVAAINAASIAGLLHDNFTQTG